MGSGVKVTVRMSPDWDKTLYSMPGVEDAVASKTAKVLASANGAATEKSGVWHETGYPHNPDKVGGKWIGNRKHPEAVGGVAARFASLHIERFGPKRKPIGLVYTANYAAIKDNDKNNTLLKALG